jgi:hypothetical protein
MPATGPDLPRRLLLLVPLAARLTADARDEIFDLFTRLATALSAGNAVGFLEPFDREMPEYARLETNILALTAQAELLCSIEVIGEGGDQKGRTIELDWLLQIRSLQESGPVERRRERVRCRAEQRGKRWKITALEPVRFFEPPRPRRR